MSTEKQLTEFCLYMNKIDTRIQKFFNSQRPYIFCKEGCSKCCKKGAFPCSEIEFELMNIGYNDLPPETRVQILSKVAKIKKEQEAFEGELFNYECPFLINDRCSIYVFRPIICRTFGLPHFDKEGKLKVPFCVDEGLNYSQVYDKTTETISSEMFEKTGYKEEPLAFNLSLSFLIKDVNESGMGLDFGEEKTIIDWF